MHCKTATPGEMTEGVVAAHGCASAARKGRVCGGVGVTLRLPRSDRLRSTQRLLPSGVGVGRTAAVSASGSARHYSQPTMLLHDGDALHQHG